MFYVLFSLINEWLRNVWILSLFFFQSWFLNYWIHIQYFLYFLRFYLQFSRFFQIYLLCCNELYCQFLFLIITYIIIYMILGITIEHKVAIEFKKMCYRLGITVCILYFHCFLILLYYKQTWKYPNSVI